MEAISRAAAARISKLSMVFIRPPFVVRFERVNEVLWPGSKGRLARSQCLSLRAMLHKPSVRKRGALPVRAALFS